MIELYIDHATDKIVGYNKAAVPGNGRDRIFLEDDQTEKLSGIRMTDKLYYLDGEIVEKDEIPEIYQEMEDLDRRLLEAQANVSNEYGKFMDGIISGMSVEEAAERSKSDRELAVQLKQQRQELDLKLRTMAEQNIRKRFEQEEEGMDFRYFLSMVTVVRDENDYLKEWIRYHVEELGFEHFYIYDNESCVPAKKYLEDAEFPYLSRVTFIDWKTTGNTQQDSHNHFLANFGKETRWFLAADPDEYVLRKDKSRSLREFLEENGTYAAVECVWHHFNANGQEKKMPGTDMERFTKEVDWYYGAGHGKMFAQSNRTDGFSNYRPHTRLDAPVMDGENEKAAAFFQLNHYYTRSYEEWLNKIQRGTAVPYARRKYAEFFELNPDMKYLDTGEDFMQEYGPAKERG